MAIGSVPGDLLASLVIDPLTDAYVGGTLNVGPLTVVVAASAWTFKTFNAGIAPSSQVQIVASVDGKADASQRRVLVRQTAADEYSLEISNPAGAADTAAEPVRFALLRGGR
jgi:hypothetical protein